MTAINYVATALRKPDETNLENALSQARATFQVINGPRFMGWLQKIADTTRVSNFNSARRILQVRPTALVKVGDVFLAPGPQRFLCAEHGDVTRSGVIFRQFKLFQMDHVVAWQRPTDVIDSVTGLKKASTQTDMGSIYCTIERGALVEDSLKIPEPNIEIITGAALQLGDVVAGATVIRVMAQLGITIAEARR